jgi:hypothetical protein
LAAATRHASLHERKGSQQARELPSEDQATERKGLIMPSQYPLERLKLQSSRMDTETDVVPLKTRNDASSARTISRGRKGFTPARLLFGEGATRLI